MGFLITYTVYAGLQWREMRKATVAAQSSATTADKTLKQYVADRRPYVIPRIIGPLKIVQGKRMEANIQLINWGQSLAVQVTTDGHVGWGHNIASGIDQYFQRIPVVLPKDGSMYLIPNIEAGAPPSLGSPGSPSFEYTTIDSGNEAPNSDAIKFILHNDRAVMAAGRIWYKDTLGNLYYTDFCFETLLTKAISKCAEHNDIH